MSDAVADGPIPAPPAVALGEPALVARLATMPGPPGRAPANPG
jgi:hypothetical protein